MEYLFNPISLLNKLKTIEGVELLKNGGSVGMYIEEAIECAEEWTNDWDEDQGFGSSDFTYALKDFIDEIISTEGLALRTNFKPRLIIEEF